MRPTKLLIFGNPKAGTPVGRPKRRLDVPLKLPVAEDADGAVWIFSNSAEYLRARHSLPENLVGNIAAAEMVARGAAGGSLPAKVD